MVSLPPTPVEGSGRRLVNKRELQVNLPSQPLRLPLTGKPLKSHRKVRNITPELYAQELKADQHVHN